MPRPGPRPYECIRRAWHSERHQPMRGSLIQEIFRLVNENHSPATQKNKEWQDKLPTVVLKAEEIMYSKANSEAEYMDLQTLWDRANDAINTIIRLDESTETGAFLQPCIEAALTLGCTPVKTSRSQRNNTSTFYLNIKNPDSNFGNYHKTTQEASMVVSPFVPCFSRIMRQHSINFPPYNLKPEVPLLPNNKCLRNNFSFPSPPSNKPPSVYPLYYVDGMGLKVDYGAPSEPPYGQRKQNGEMGFIQKPYFLNPLSKIDATQVNLRYTDKEHSNEDECDLSLRLGPSTVKTSQSHDVSDFHNSKRWNPKGEKVDLDARMRKGKAVVSNAYENLDFCWQPKVSSANSNGGS